MLVKAAQNFGDEIDLADSYMVGDMSTDIGAGEAAGVETILVETGFAGKDGRWKGTPDHVLPDFKGAVEYILAQRA
jgi:ribonucleotide monophosphatase NagD (HAD superfamily)